MQQKVGAPKRVVKLELPRAVALLPVALGLGWLGAGSLLARPADYLIGSLLLALGSVIFIVAAPSPRAGVTLKLPAAPTPIDRIMLPGLAPLALLLASIAAAAYAFIVFDQKPLDPARLIAAWFVGMVLFLVAVFLYQRQTSDRSGSLRTALKAAFSDRAEILALATIAVLTVGAFLARADNLGGLPMNVHGDEGDMGLIARAIMLGEARNPFVTSWLDFPNLWFFIQAASLRLFGDSVSGLRMVSAIVGAAGIPAVYFMGRATFGRFVGLVAGALLAAYHFHIHFSRMGVNNIADPLLMTLTFGGFFWGYTRRTWLGFAVAGVALGLMQHFYVSGRLAPILLAILLIHQLITSRHALWRSKWGLLIMLVGAVIALGPLLLHYIRIPGALTNRINTVSIFGSGYIAQRQAAGISLESVLVDQFRLGLGAYTFEPDHGSWYVSGMPLLDQASAVLAVFGLAVATSRWRNPNAMLWLAWLMGTAAAGGMLTTNAPEVQRYISAAPALCVMMAVAIQTIAAAGQTASARLALSTKIVVGSALTVALMVSSLSFYFLEYGPKSFRVGSGSAEETTLLGYYLRSLREPVSAYILGSTRNDAIRFVAPNASLRDLNQTAGPTLQITPETGSSKIVFVLLPPRVGELAALQQKYPGGSIQRVRALSDNRLLFTAYAVTP
jgi:4-amino-4-deoxy-L-arabinose transferase-like glycosyltransferase